MIDSVREVSLNAIPLLVRLFLTCRIFIHNYGNSFLKSGFPNQIKFKNEEELLYFLLILSRLRLLQDTGRCVPSGKQFSLANLIGKEKKGDGSW